MMNRIRNYQWLVASAAVVLAAILAAAQAPPSPPMTPPSPQVAPAPVAPPAPESPRTRVHTMVLGSGSYLGVDVRDINAERMRELKLSEERGAEVTMVDRDSPAGKAGLKPGDVIASFNGEKIESVEELKRKLRETPPGRTITLGIARDGKPMSVTAQLANREEMMTRAMPHVVIPRIEIPRIEIPNFEVVTRNTVRAGVSVERLTQQLAGYFGVPGGEGLLITEVQKGSPAEAAGFRAGDVIVKVNNDHVTNAGDLRMAISENQGKTIPVTVVREKHEQTLQLKVPERRERDSSALVLDLGGFDQLAMEVKEIGPEIEREMREFRLQMEDSKQELKMKQKQLKDESKELKKKIELHINEQ